MDNIRKLMLYRQAIRELKSVENLFGEQVLQKDSYALTKDDEQFFCEICNSIQSIMQQLFDYAEIIHKMGGEQDDASHAVVDEKMAMIDSIIRMAHMKLHGGDYKMQ